MFLPFPKNPRPTPRLAVTLPSTRKSPDTFMLSAPTPAMMKDEDMLWFREGFFFRSRADLNRSIWAENDLFFQNNIF
jgi:hypothetical protein